MSAPNLFDTPYEPAAKTDPELTWRQLPLPARVASAAAELLSWALWVAFALALVGWLSIAGWAWLVAAVAVVGTVSRVLVWRQTGQAELSLTARNFAVLLGGGLLCLIHKQPVSTLTALTVTLIVCATVQVLAGRAVSRQV